MKNDPLGDRHCTRAGLLARKQEIKMVRLAIDMEMTAQALGTDRKALVEFIEREQIPGVLKLNGEWRVSVFTLAQLLNTTPEMLIEVLEDATLGDLLDEVDDDDWFEGEEGQQVYQRYLSGAET
jgi:hypothetical protein